MENVLTAATVIIPVTIGLTEAYKAVFGGSKRLPLVNYKNLCGVAY